MKTKWDYSELADAYLMRPDYSEEAINKIFNIIGNDSNYKICDVGAGVAHLTLQLAKRGFDIYALEPNDSMRAKGSKRTQELKNVQWFEGTAEVLPFEDNMFDVITFGSSFNVTDRMIALKECHRVLREKGWFICMWNHRDLTDDIQSEIEDIIKNNIEDYSYGSRREDQTHIIEKSGFFKEVFKVEGTVNHIQTIEACVQAWKSHATLQRQAGSKFNDIIVEIENFLKELGTSEIMIPYTTRVWLAQIED